MKIPVIDYAKPYIVVSSKRMRKEAHERALANSRKRKPKEPPKRKNAKDASFDADDATPEPQQLEVEDEDSASAANAPLDAENTLEEDAFVVSKVEYFSTTNGLCVLIWSVLGYVRYISFILQMR